MAKVYIGLGSNQGERLATLELAIQTLAGLFTPGSLEVSSVYETPPLLPKNAPIAWNIPYFNLVLSADFPGSPHELLLQTQYIEKSLGRIDGERWSPRPIDIDLLHFDGVEMKTPSLNLPHPGLLLREFVLTPLAEIAPSLKFGQLGGLQNLRLARPLQLPKFMGIFNATPDSFSDGGVHLTEKQILNTLPAWESVGISILDLGGESTRPGSTEITADEEWRRLGPLLEVLNNRYRNRWLRPKISVDTYKAETAAKALEFGADIINDVRGLQDPAMLEILQGAKAKIVLMHPVKLAPEMEPVRPVHEWFQEKLEHLDKKGIHKERVILDPGIGFGKNALQSEALLRGIHSFQDFKLPLLVGHSRKSFIKSFTPFEASLRDPETLGISLALNAKGVDILRVHDPVLNHRAILAWNHIQG